MTIQQQWTPQHDEDLVTELTSEEFRAAVERELSALGLTYTELKHEAERREFSSAQAHSLWMAIGGTVDL